MDLCHLTNANLESIFQNFQGRSPSWHCKRRLWSLCSFHWRLVCVTDDCSKDYGIHGDPTRPWWTSSRQSICVHPGKNWRRFQTSQTSEVIMSWHMDTYSTTQMAKIMVEHSRSSGSSWTKFVRTPTCWIVVGKTVRKSSMSKLGWDNLPTWECLLVHRKHWYILIGTRGWH